MSGTYPTILPRVNWGMAVGYDETNGTILLLGGFSFRQQFVTFDGTTFNDQGTGYMSGGVRGNQYYSQLGKTLWMINDIGVGFITMNT